MGSGTTVTLGPEVIRRWARLTHEALGARRGDLDELNVFPVADSDTGTNLYLTFGEARRVVESQAQGASARAVATAFARGALVGARGNSGVILGEYVGALLRSLVPEGQDDGADLPLPPTGLARALAEAADASYQAVAEPVEGTVLTVARAVGAAVGAGPTDAPALLEHGIAEGYRALSRTRSQLPVLRAAGVLDAGAWGLLLVLDSLSEALGSASAHGRTLDEAPAARPATARTDDAIPDGGEEACAPDAPSTAHHGGGEFEVMYLVAPLLPRPVPGTAEGSDPASRLRAGLSAVGESVAVVGGDGLWQAHVHTDTPLAAIAVADGLDATPSQIRVRHLASQSGVHGRHRPRLGLVAVTTAPGLVAELARAGAVVVLVPPGGSCGPELGRAVDDTGAAQVVLLAAGETREVPAHDGLLVLQGLTEAQVVGGCATWASLDPAQAETGLREAVRDAVTSMRTEVLTAPDGDVGGVGHAEIVNRAMTSLLSGGAALVTAVTSSWTTRTAIDALRANVSAAGDAELVLLAGEAPGTSITVGVE